LAPRRGARIGGRTVLLPWPEPDVFHERGDDVFGEILDEPQRPQQQ